MSGTVAGQPPVPSAGAPHRWTTHLRASALLLFLLLVVTGAAYPAALSGLGALATPGTAGGSLAYCANGTLVASTLIAQNFSAGPLGPGLFWARPSPTDYNTTLGAVTPPGPSDPAIRNATWALVNETVAYLELYGNTSVNASVPLWLVSPSGSSVDPDLSVGAALVQVVRVAHADNLSVPSVTALVNAHITAPVLPYLGVPYVDVVSLDLSLLRSMGRC